MGPRRTVLLLLGLLWVGMGWTVTVSGPVDPGDAILYEALPVWVRVTAWALTGCLAIFGATLPHLDKIGYSALLVMPAERFISLVWSQIEWVRPGPPPGTVGIPGALVWGVVLALIWVVMQWPDTPRGERGE